jgi:hypothetical protein
MSMQFVASKWLHVDFLITHTEMGRLLAALEEEHSTLFLFSTLGVRKQGENQIVISEFLQACKEYEEALQKRAPIPDASFRFFFTGCITKYEDAVTKIALREDRESIIAHTPCLQMQPHRFSYSKLDGKFRSMVFGKSSVSWGIRISYPQLYQIPNTRTVEDALDEVRFPNAALFSSLRRWMRHNTLPTPIFVASKRVNTPFRIGKECMPWINKHPELGELQIHL